MRPYETAPSTAKATTGADPGLPHEGTGLVGSRRRALRRTRAAADRGEAGPGPSPSESGS
ncbi:hypothetical protein GCM10027203_30490 [Nonomuraea fastidiosa]|jgi:hypothetical protein